VAGGNFNCMVPAEELGLIGCFGKKAIVTECSLQLFETSTLAGWFRSGSISWEILPTADFH
jgi:hypothetical protein